MNIKICHNIHGRRKHFGLKQQVNATINESMGDTLFKIYMEISDDNAGLKLWDKAKLVFGTRRTKIGKNNISLEDKMSTICMVTKLI